LHPETGWSSLRFLILPPSIGQPKLTDWRWTVLVPAALFTPFKEFPSPAAVPHHCGRCPPAVLSLVDRLEHRNARPDRLRVNRTLPTVASLAAEAAQARLSSSFVRSPSLAFSTAEAIESGPPRCVAASPEGVLAGRLTERRSARCENRFAMWPKPRCSPSFPAHCCVLPMRACPRDDPNLFSRVRSPLSPRRHPRRRPKPALVSLAPPRTRRRVQSICSQASGPGVQRGRSDVPRRIVVDQTESVGAASVPLSRLGGSCD
jgi:hypothetical protein